LLYDGDLVELHFHGTLDNGQVFDTSRGRSPRYFVLGRGQLIPAFDAQVRHMVPGELRTFTIAVTDAYGDRDPSLVFVVPRNEAPDGAVPGDMVQLTGGRPGTITAVDPEIVTVDANHPLAGQTLHFEVELLSVKHAVPDR
jgi:peptidylprolyl isomerase